MEDFLKILNHLMSLDSPEDFNDITEVVNSFDESKRFDTLERMKNLSLIELTGDFYNYYPPVYSSAPNLYVKVEKKPIVFKAKILEKGKSYIKTYGTT